MNEGLTELRRRKKKTDPPFALLEPKEIKHALVMLKHSLATAAFAFKILKTLIP